MRTTAGIILMVFGAILLAGFVPLLIFSGYGPYIIPKCLFFVVSAVVIFCGGVFCLWAEAWQLCFSSALLMVVIMTIWLLTGLFSAKWLSGLLTSASILPIIFICLRKSEWWQSQG